MLKCLIERGRGARGRRGTAAGGQGRAEAEGAPEEGGEDVEDTTICLVMEVLSFTPQKHESYLYLPQKIYFWNTKTVSETTP